MGTRSTMAMRKPDGGFIATYCHWDGYPRNNGKILNEHYDSDEKVQDLLALGDLSSLRPEVGEKHRFPGDHEVCSTAAWRQLYDNWTTAYHRDRGEEWSTVAPQHFKDAKEWVDSMSESWCEWAYMWDGEQWLVHKITQDVRPGESEGYPLFDFAEIAIKKDAEMAN